MTRERDYRLDWLRVIAISLIVLMHTPRPSSAPGYFLAGISYLTAPGLVLFFMISGSLLLGNSLTAKDFIKRRFLKILSPTLVWTAFYLIVSYFRSSMQLKELIWSVISIPFSAQGNHVLWFMYTLAGLYLLTPILSRWLKVASKREVEFYLLLWGITLCYPYLTLVLDINEGTTGILYYFSGYVGYFVLGYYLKHFYSKCSSRLIVVSITLAIAIPIVIYSSGVEFDFYSMLWYLSLPVALMAFCWFIGIYRLPIKRSALIEQASALSFGVYLVHKFIMKHVVYSIDFICDLPGMIQIPSVTIITLLVSYFLVWLISRLPFSKYIIGV